MLKIFENKFRIWNFDIFLHKSKKILHKNIPDYWWSAECQIPDDPQAHPRESNPGWEQLSSGTDGLNPPTVVSPTIGDDRFDKVAHPHISPAVNLNQPNELFGLSSRVVATESL